MIKGDTNDVADNAYAGVMAAVLTAIASAGPIRPGSQQARMVHDLLALLDKVGGGYVPWPSHYAQAALTALRNVKSKLKPEGDLTDAATMQADAVALLQKQVAFCTDEAGRLALFAQQQEFPANVTLLAAHKAIRRAS